MGDPEESEDVLASLTEKEIAGDNRHRRHGVAEAAFDR